MDYIKKYDEWINNYYFNNEVKQELLNIKDDIKEIEYRFYKDLEFGTASLRGVIAARANRIDKIVYYIRQK